MAHATPSYPTHRAFLITVGGCVFLWSLIVCAIWLAI